MSERRQLAFVKDYDGLIEALKRRACELDLTNQTIDELAGLQSGYTGKLFGPRQGRSLGGVSFGLMLQTLGVGVVLVEDPEALARIAARYEKRKVAPRMLPNRSIPKATWLLGTRQARKLNKIRTEKLTPAKRSAIAKKAAKTRWKNVRKKRREARLRRLATLPVVASPSLVPQSSAGSP